jgi:hypothetical protein
VGVFPLNQLTFQSVVSQREVIDTLASSIVGLDCVDQRIVVGLPVNDSPTAATSTVTLPVFDVVLVVLEAGRSEIEVDAVHRHQLGQQVGISLLF